MKVLSLLPAQPFPATNGQTHRLSHVVRSLAQRHEVWLACVGAPDQGPMPQEVAALFREVLVVPETPVDSDPLSRWRRRLLAAVPHDVFRFRSAAMAHFVSRVLADHRPDVILTGDPALSQYLPKDGPPAVLDYVCEGVLQIERIRDLVGMPEALLWAGRRRKAVRFLRGLSSSYAATFLNSVEDVDSLARFWPRDRLQFVPNGLELESYPLGLASPVAGRMIYPGSVLYPPNRDAVEWFATSILPRIRAAVPGAELHVTGAFDATAPQAEGLCYTGRVPDVRVEIAAAAVSVVPLRLGAGGARFKVIESLALGTPVVGTAIAVEGLALADGTDYLAAEGEDQIAQACIALLRDPDRRSRISAGGRGRMEADYNWQQLFLRIEATMFEAAAGSPRKKGASPTRAPAKATALVAVAAAALLAAMPGRLRAEDYRLAAGDVLTIQVLDRPDLSVATARLQPGGRLMLPRLGSLDLGGMTAEGARDVIEDRLRSVEGLARPDVTVEIREYRPVFVTGDVNGPGGFEYSPGMTVLQAITLAGGFVRPEPADANARLEAGRLRQQLAQNDEKTAVALVSLARLTAEANETEFAAPAAAAGLVTPDRLATLMATETAIMAERRQTFVGLLRSLASLQSEYDNEIKALTGQLAAKEAQTALIREEAEKVGDLAVRNLVSLDRALEVRSAAIQIDAEKLEIQAFISRAQSARGRLDQDALGLRSQRRHEILSGIKEQQDILADLALASAGARAQLAVADRLSAGIGGAEYRAIQRLGGGEAMTVIRPGPDGDRVIPVSLLDRMEPDDILFVPYQTVVPAGGAPQPASK